MKYILILLTLVFTSCTSMQSSKNDTSSTTYDPAKPWIYQNKPNPFSEWTDIIFYIPEDRMDVILNVYNKKGDCVKVLYNGKCEKGNHQVSYNNKNNFVGTLTYQMIANWWKSPIMYMTMYKKK